MSWVVGRSGRKRQRCMRVATISETDICRDGAGQRRLWSLQVSIAGRTKDDTSGRWAPSRAHSKRH